MNIIEKGRILESRCNAFFAGLPELKVDTYFLGCALLMFATGMGLFIYSIIFNLNIMLIVTISNPLFFLILGMICCFVYISIRWGARHGV